MKLGVRAHDFGKLPVDELASRIARHGLTCVQLAPSKALAGCENVPGALDVRFAKEVRDTFERHGIEISVLGCYINLGDQDAAQRRTQLERFKEHLRFAHHVGCARVGTETGSLNSDFSRHPENQGEAAFQVVLAGVRELVAEAAQCGVNVAIEAVERYIISSPQRLRRLVDEVNSPHLQVIYDPVNLLWLNNHAAQDQVMDDAESLLAERIRVVHAKDFTVADEQFLEQPAGRGQLHYPRLMRWVKQHADVPVLLENTHPTTIAETVAFMRGAYRSA